MPSWRPAGDLCPQHRQRGFCIWYYPGLHSTIFPPYFVAGRSSGFAMVLTYIPLRSSFTSRPDHRASPGPDGQGHAAMGLVVAYGYLTER